MTIRTSNLGGADFFKGERLYPVDLNDTVDEIVRLVENGY